MAFSTRVAFAVVAVAVLAASFVTFKNLQAKPLKKTLKNLTWTPIGAQNYFTIQKVTMTGSFAVGTKVTTTTDITALQSFTHQATHVKLTYKFGIISKVVTDADFAEASPKTLAPGPGQFFGETTVNQDAPSGTYIIVNDIKDASGRVLQSFQIKYDLA